MLETKFHTHKNHRNIMVLYIQIFTFLDSRQEDKRFCTEWHQALPEFILLLIFDLLLLFPNTWTVPYFQRIY
jgi:hypothetical protein